jgi:hypothetical protein
MSRTRFAVFGLLLTASVAWGQTPPAQPKEPDPKAGKKDGVTGPGKDGKPAPKESPRLQKLKQLSYDRRPSSILTAWANLEAGSKKETPKDTLDKELASFQREVTLGNWLAVKAFLAKLPSDEGKAGYQQLLKSLAGGPPAGPAPGAPPPGVPPHLVPFLEKNWFVSDDILGLAAAAPFALDREALKLLGAILKQSLATGTVIEDAAARLKAEVARSKGKAALTQRQAAHILADAGAAPAAGDFLPSLTQAIADKDNEALNLLTRHFLARHAADKKADLLEKAWQANQAALATAKAARQEVEDSIKLAVELAPKVKAALGQTWLDQSFTSQPERGMDILATLGSVSSKGLTTHPRDADLRGKVLKLQLTAVDALVKVAAARAKEWRATLSLLAGGWLREAEFSQQNDNSALEARLRRDRFGNPFFLPDEFYPPGGSQNNPQQPLPVLIRDVLEARPSKSWVALVEDGLRPRLGKMLAQLHLKAGDEGEAFPHIQQLAKTNRADARELVKEYLRVWTRNHDPNAERAMTRPYFYYFGFERQAEGIPLTRAKQERNLIELADVVTRLRALQVGDLDEELLAKAFTTSHSSAEVYRLEAVEKVFGPIKSIKPRTLASLTQQMRENLAGLWREPAVQKDKKTNRKTKDIQAEVLRGYELAQSTIEGALQKLPGHWALLQARAALMHDENNYCQELSKSTSFTRKRLEALAGFQAAARSYAAKVKDLAEDEESVHLYEQWFAASLGACDLKHIKEDKLPEAKQPALIRKALLSLPGPAADRHLSKFANALFTHMSAVGPAVKFRYLKAGVEIVGGHKDALEARKVYDYFKDLVNEIKLEAVVDGSDVVGHKQTFGVFVNLRHTREIERESGGFGRYLQNQNSGQFFYYNYGRPTTDYRDRFQAVVNEACKEHFEILSVTFQSDKVNSRALPEYGWRYTPYAYLLLKARGPQVDKLPPLRLDLDFLETTGYVIIPVESPAVPLDCAPVKGKSRPFRKLQVTQTLDERQADKGKLLLEIKATALGLLPELDRILEVRADGFEVAKVDDQGVSVARFDPDAEQNVVVAERSWVVTLTAVPGESPALFRFPAAKVPQAGLTFQRYQDADLVTVASEVDLEMAYGGSGLWWLWLAIGGGVLLLLTVLLVLWLGLRRPHPKQVGRWPLPRTLTPFTVLGLLRRIDQEDSLAEPQRQELREAIALLERRYFAGDGNSELDLRGLAEAWAQRGC